MNINLRLAKSTDCQLLFEWVNDSSVRSASFNSKMITIEEHEHWFKKKINDRRCIMFIAYQQATQAIGQIRFELLDKKNAGIDISIDKNHRGKGLSHLLIINSLQQIKKAYDVKSVTAYIKAQNQASISAFLKAGFIKQPAINNHSTQLTFELSRMR